MIEALKEQIRQLSVDEQWELISEVSDELLLRDEMPEWHREELDRRIAKYESTPLEGSSWEEVNRRITGP